MILALLLQSTAPAPETLSLRCTGGAVVMATTSTTQGGAIDNRGNMVTGGASTAEPVPIELIVEFRMSNGQATLRLPAAAYGEGNIRGARLEEKVEQLRVTDTEITGTVRMDILSKAKFRIDRITGEMTSRGGFRGPCVPIDMQKRAF